MSNTWQLEISVTALCATVNVEVSIGQLLHNDMNATEHSTWSD